MGSEAPAPDATPSALDGARLAAIDLIESAVVSLHLYTPRVEPRIHGDPDLAGALRARIAAQRRLQVQLLFPAAAGWQHACPLLVEAVRQLTSNCAVRALPPDLPRDRDEFRHGFVVADREAFLHAPDGRRPDQFHTGRGGDRPAALMAFFDDVWAHADPDPDLRVLRI